MLATIINAASVLLGAFLGLLFKKRLSENLRTVVFAAAGMLALVIGITMCVQVQRVLYLAVALMLGGIIGTILRVEAGILRFGEFLRTLGPRREGELAAAKSGDFAQGFLEASVLFCVGSMAIIGAIQAGTKGDYALLLTKSVMDGAVAMLLAAGMGIGVAASAISVLLYQGLLTLLSGFLEPWISPLVKSMLSATGGPLVIMVGLNLLSIKRFQTADFLPALVFAVGFALIDPVMPSIIKA